jgi:SAM-dependent methyltransferase
MMSGVDDPEAYRAESRERWEGAAAGWAATREAFQRDTAPVSEWLLDATALRPGMTVLEVAAGTGDLGLEAARRVAPDGKAIITDGAEAMVEVARARAAELGVENAEIRPMEAEWLDLPAGAVDAVVSRWAHMLLADPEAGLREARRVLRSGGRIALAVWDVPERNPWVTRVQRVLLERGHVERPRPGEPGPFALADRERLEDLLWGAGFADVAIDAVAFEFHAPSLDAWWDHLTRNSPTLASTLATLSPAEHYAVREDVDAAYAEFVAPDGTVTIPARTLVASAEA